MHPVVFYDGQCGLCNFWVQWILDRDKERIFHFAALQSPFAEELFRSFGQELSLQSIVVLNEDREFFKRSRAVLYLLSHVKRTGFFYRLLKAAPRCLADFGYNMVAVIRRMFRRNSCRLFTREERALFLNDTKYSTWASENIPPKNHVSFPREHKK